MIGENFMIKFLHQFIFHDVQELEMLSKWIENERDNHSCKNMFYMLHFDRPSSRLIVFIMTLSEFKKKTFDDKIHQISCFSLSCVWNIQLCM